MVQNCFTALGDTMSNRFEREGYSWPSAVLQSTDYCHSAEQTLLATSGHPEPSVPFINFTLRTCPSLLRLSANESNAAISIVWFIGCYSLQRQGRLGKTPRLGPRGQFSEARSFHSMNENVALHIISYYVALPETNIGRVHVWCPNSALTWWNRSKNCQMGYMQRRLHCAQCCWTVAFL